MTMSSTGGAYPNVTAEELAEARRYAMEIAWSSEDDVFVVSFPDAPGVMTHGSTREEAAAMGEDAIITWLTALHDVGRPVPPPASAAAGDGRPPDDGEPSPTVRCNAYPPDSSTPQCVSYGVRVIISWRPSEPSPPPLPVRWSDKGR